MLPFLSQRYAVRAAEIVANTPSENVRAYDEQVRQVIASLTGGFGADTVNLVMSHITCVGGDVRRRRAVRPVDLRVQRAREHLPRLRALRRARPPAPAAVAARARPGALQRRAARGGLRRAGQHERRLPGRGGARHPGPGHRHPGHVRAAAAHRARHARRARGAGRRLRRRLPAGVPARADPRRAARRHDRDPAERPRGAHRPGVRARGRRRARLRPSRAPRGRPGSCSPTTAPRGTSATRGSRPCSRELHDEVTATDGAPTAAELSPAS